MIKGKFISLEGGDGSGKSTQAGLLAKRLEDIGYETVVTREPGGSQKAEVIRTFLLEGRAQDYGPLAEAILFGVARDDHIAKRIAPALEGGKWVICDRFADSTRAYQGTSGLDEGLIRALEQMYVGDAWPDLTIILDLPAKDGLARAAARANGKDRNGEPDRYEALDIDFHESLRAAFRTIAENEPERCVLIDASEGEEAVAEKIWDVVASRLAP